MAPIERYPNSAAAPLPPFPKTRSEVAARPALIELETLVTIHCARIVEGSDKREPLSETTRTVLVSSHGAVVRLAATLVPGQLIFLFNERTQKGVVCEVVKSIPGGSASGFVELQFSEPAAGFWDLPIAVAPPASVSAPPIAPADLETIPPVPPAVAKAAAPKPVATVPTFIAPVNPTMAAPPFPTVKQEGATPQSAASTNSAPQSSIVPAVAAPPPPKVSPTQAGAVPASPAVPPVPDAPNPATSTSSLRDFSKEISVLLAAALAAAPKPFATVPTFIAPVNPTMAAPPFPTVKPEGATPQSAASTNSAPQSSVVSPVAAPLTPQISSAQAGTPASPAIPPAPVAPNPAIGASSLLDFSKEVSAPARTDAPSSPQVSPVTSTAPRPSPAFSLPSVEQLMLAATPLQASLESLRFSATPPALPAPSAPPAQNTKPPYTQAAKTDLEFARSEPEAVVKSESESFLPGHQEIPPSVAVESCLGVAVSSEESIDVLVVEEPRRWQMEESDAGLLCKSPVQSDRVTSAGPKKVLTLGLAASVLLVLGAVTFYLRQDHSATRTPATAQSLGAPPSPVSLRPAKNAATVPSHAASATVATSQLPSAPIANWLAASALVEPSSLPAPVEPSPAPAATQDPQPGANPPAAESQSTIPKGELTTAGTSNAAPEPAPADVPSHTTEVAEETPERRPGVQLGGLEKPSAELAALDPDRHRVSFGEDESQAFQQGQHAGCTKNVTLGSVGKEKLYLGIPEWASRWIEKNSKKLPGICFSDSPMSGARNFLIVFYALAEPAQTELLTTAPSSSAAAWPEGQGAFTTSYGSTWHYHHDETVGTTVTSLLPDDSPHGRPAHVSYAMAYTEDGMPISQRRPPTETKKSKESAKPGKTRDESTGVYRELDALLSLVVTDIEKR